MVGIHLLRQHRTQWAPSWKGLHTLVVKPPNVGKGYAIVMSESHHEVYMFMFVKSQRSVEKNHLKISLIQSLKEMKNKRLNGVQLRIVKKLGLTNRNGNTSHMHTHAHMLITILFKSKNPDEYRFDLFLEMLQMDRCGNSLHVDITITPSIYVRSIHTHTYFAYVLDSLAM